MSFCGRCLVVPALCALLLCAGCAAQEPLFFVADNVVYVLPADGGPQKVYESDEFYTERSIYLADRTPYLLDGETLYRIERDLTVSRLFDLEGANDESLRMTRDGFQSSRHFAVTVKDGVVTAYYMDHKNPEELDGAASPEQMGEATQTIVASSSDGTVRRYDVPMWTRGGFTVTDTAILTTQYCVVKSEERGKRATKYIGLYQTDLATGEIQPLQSIQGEGGTCYAMMVGEAAMYINQPDSLDDFRLHYLRGSTEQWSMMMPHTSSGFSCQCGDAEAYADGFHCIRLFWKGEKVAVIERAEEEAWADWWYNNDLFTMTTDGTRMAVSVLAESLEEFYVYVVDRETGQLLQRLTVPAPREYH